LSEQFVAQWPDVRSRATVVLLLGALILLHLANAVVPSIYNDEATFVNVGATLATLGEYGNTWQSDSLQAPDRYASVGPPIVFPVALAWKFGIRDPVGVRLLVATPYFLGFLLLFYQLISDLDLEIRLVTLSLLIGIPHGGLFSARVLGEFPAMCLCLAGVLCLLRQRFLAGSLAWGLAALCKLAFLPGLLLGWAVFCLVTKRGWPSLLRVALVVPLPLAGFLLWIWLRYSSFTDLSLALQGRIVLFHPRSFPLNLASLEFYMPIVLIVLAYAWVYLERDYTEKILLLCCLSLFFLVWQLVGFRGWLRYVLPGLIMLAPAAASAVVGVWRRLGKGPLTVALTVTVAAFIFLGLYDNTYTVWTYYKDWREQRRITGFLEGYRGRKLLADRKTFLVARYQWSTGQQFQDAQAAQATPGDLLFVSDESAFFQQELAAGRIGEWKLVFAAPLAIPPVEIFEKH
jgi:hypothetical protein